MVPRSGPRYVIEWDPRAEAELDHLRAFDARIIVRVVEALAHDAETPTRHRKPLREPIEDVPTASWELRASGHRVYYDIRVRSDEPGETENLRTARILRVILKGRRTTHEAVSKKP
jgi:mRNA-degrading endonuclease RelE of RelBE toxin-antitoxin system